MKKLFNRLIYCITWSVMILLYTSCNKYLEIEPTSSIGPETAFGTIENAYKTILGAYQPMAGDQGYGSRFSIYFPFDTDDMMGQNGAGDNGRRDLNRYNLHPVNSQLIQPFTQLYSGIERANHCIKYIPGMKQFTEGTSLEIRKLKRFYGEALTLRAQYYFELVRVWGDVPAQWEPSENQKDLFLPKTDRDSIYEHILNDLLLAEALVPWRSEIKELGENMDERITKGAVKGLRAKIALFRGGYSLRRNKRMERGAGHLKYYDIAAQECESIIDAKEHSLNTSFENLWKNNVNAHRIDPSGEILFEVAMGGSTTFSDSKIGYFNGPVGNIMPLPTYFYSFDSMDTRRDVTIAPFTVNNDRTLRGSELCKLADGKFRINWISNPTIDIGVGTTFMGLNWPLIRYSDVLLMYAEAVNELKNGPTDKALDAVEAVRTRAFAGDESIIGIIPTNKKDFFEFIVKERMLEFGGEGIRKYDLIRWNLLGDKLKEAKLQLTALSERKAPYNNLPEYMYYTPNYTAMKWINSFYKPSPDTGPIGSVKVEWVNAAMLTKHNWHRYAEGFTPNKSELYPLPQQATGANPNLKQDFGY